MNVTNASAATGMSSSGDADLLQQLHPELDDRRCPLLGERTAGDDRCKVRVVQQHGAEVAGDVEHRLDGLIREGAAQVAEAFRLVLDHRVEQGGLVLEVAVDGHRVHIQGGTEPSHRQARHSSRVDDLDRRLDDALAGQAGAPRPSLHPPLGRSHRRPPEKPSVRGGIRRPNG